MGHTASTAATRKRVVAFPHCSCAGGLCALSIGAESEKPNTPAPSPLCVLLRMAIGRPRRRLSESFTKFTTPTLKFTTPKCFYIFKKKNCHTLSPALGGLQIP